jgi:hypothetical protein
MPSSIAIVNVASNISYRSLIQADVKGEVFADLLLNELTNLINVVIGKRNPLYSIPAASLVSIVVYLMLTLFEELYS